MSSKTKSSFTSWSEEGVPSVRTIRETLDSAVMNFSRVSSRLLSVYTTFNFVWLNMYWGEGFAFCFCYFVSNLRKYLELVMIGGLNP